MGSHKTLGRVLALIGVALLVMTTNVAASVFYMVLYGHVIDPGHDSKYYQEHIQLELAHGTPGRLSVECAS